MFCSTLLALAASLSTASAAVYTGFNYGSGLDYNTEFALAKQLVGTNGAFTSARLYTMIEASTANTPTSAIPAAISNDVTLLLGLWASAGQADFDDELTALTSAITTYGTAFTSRVAGIGVGSEDLYRNSPTGIENMSGAGAQPTDLVSYIAQVRAAIKGTSLAAAPVGHIDTWTAWVNTSNDAVIVASDFIGLDGYPYYQTTDANAVANGYDLFFASYDATVGAVGSKPVWVTETGWPVSGPNQNQAVASVDNAQAYWQAVGCKLFGTTNTYWYILDDSGASPSFGVSTGSSTPLYNLTCGTSASSSSTGSTTSSVATLMPVTSTSQAIVSVTSSLTASGSAASGSGSPADTTSASADSSASSLQSVSSSAYSSALSSASSALSSASSALAAAKTDSTTASSTAASASSAASTSTSTASASTTGTSTASTTSASASASASKTGAASAMHAPTAGLLAALVALLVFV